MLRIEKNNDDKIKKLKNSKMLICNDTKNEVNKRFLNENVGTRNINGSENKKSSTSENEINRTFGHGVVLKELNDTKKIKKSRENGPSTTDTYRDKKTSDGEQKRKAED